MKTTHRYAFRYGTKEFVVSYWGTREVCDETAAILAQSANADSYRYLEN